MRRTTWHLAVGALVAGWLLAAATVGLLSLLDLFGDLGTWLMIHLLLLGAVSNAILIWSTYFAAALLRLPGPTSRRGEASRLALFNAGALIVVVAMTHRAWWALVGGAALASTAVAWHALVLLSRMRRSLPSRFGMTVRYYLAAAALLPVGIALGAVMAPDDLDQGAHARLALAHVGINLFGWMGLTVLGTLVTLWPTMLHTRIADGAERAARRALPVLLTSVVVLATGALAGSRALTVAGILGYLSGMAVAGRPLAQEARHHPPGTYATWSVLAGSVWLTGSVAALAVIVATSPGWEQAADSADHLAGPLLVGFAAQTLLGALSYLIPVVLGGGPTAARASIRMLDTAGGSRVVVVNAGLAVALLPLPAPAGALVLVAVLGALALFLPLAIRAVLVARRLTRGRAAAPVRTSRDPAHPATGEVELG
jgi:nitrite reductase (NO-forming)